MNKDLKKIMRCPKCGAPFVPDPEAISDYTGKWDGHTYKPSCDDAPNIRVSVG